MEQLKLNFEGGLTDRFEALMDVVVAVIADAPVQKKSISMDLDIQPSNLSRMMPGGDLRFPADKIEGLIEVTKDYRPIYFLIEKFLKDPETKKAQAIEQLAALLPQIQKLVASVSDDKVRVVK